MISELSRALIMLGIIFRFVIPVAVLMYSSESLLISNVICSCCVIIFKHCPQAV